MNRIIGLYMTVVSLLFGLMLVPLKRHQATFSLYDINLVIDPGHGGKDNGACYDDVYEDEINLKISTFLLDMCISHDINASITRVGDYDLASLYASNRKREDLKKRVNYINSSGADYFISIHMNSYKQNQNVKGPMVYYDASKEESYDLASFILDGLNSFAEESKPLHIGDFYLFNHALIPGVLIECGFISNQKERTKLCKESYQKEVAEVIFKGFSCYIKNKFNYES